MKKILIFTLTTLLLAACQEYDINEVLLVHSDISLSVKGKTQYTFDPSKGQVALNAEKTLYRYVADDLSSWLELRCQSKPGGVGDTFVAELKWKSKISSGDMNNLSFEVKQTDEAGMIWLWNSTNNIGVIIRDFE